MTWKELKDLVEHELVENNVDENIDIGYIDISDDLSPAEAFVEHGMLYIRDVP